LKEHNLVITSTKIHTNNRA